jgi:homoserine kinase
LRVRVPATSANLGPGFDALGLALALYDDVVVRVTDEPGLSVDVAGMGAASVPRNARHLVVKSMKATFRVLGGAPAGLEVVCANRIPHGRGLGSSAAAIVAGVIAARGAGVRGEDRRSS